MPANFDLQFTLVPPPDVQGSEHLIRYLVLDLYTTPRDGAHNRELNRGTQSMASLKSLFPSLESCVFVIRLAHAGRLLQTLIQLADETLTHRNVKKIGNIISLRRTLVEFIDAFLERGPGKRKFIRFIHSNFYHPEDKVIRSLVLVSSEGSSDAMLRPGATNGEKRSAADAERIFLKAY
jgi:hypothetical protein